MKRNLTKNAIDIINDELELLRKEYLENRRQESSIELINAIEKISNHPYLYFNLDYIHNCNDKNLLIWMQNILAEDSFKAQLMRTEIEDLEYKLFITHSNYTSSMIINRLLELENWDKYFVSAAQNYGIMIDSYLTNMDSLLPDCKPRVIQ